MKMRDRAANHATIQSVLSNPEDGLFKSKTCNMAMLRMLKTNDRHFNAEGLSLKQSCIKLKNRKNLVVPNEKLKAKSFLRQVNDIIESNLE